MNNQDFPLICLECQQIPSVSYNNFSEILIHCFCGFEKKLLISDYLEQIKKKRKIEINNKCWFHPNNCFEFYCIDCEIHLCNLCYEIHNNQHKIIDFTIPINTTKIQDDLDMVLENIKIDLLIMRNKEIKCHLDKINEIEFQYKQKIEQIKVHAQFIKIIINNYTKYKCNFNCITNVLTNCYFNQNSIQKEFFTFKDYCNSISLIYPNNPFNEKIKMILIDINNNKKRIERFVYTIH